MSTFRAVYEDWEDGQSEDFNVDAKNILEAWHKAWDYIHSLPHGGSLELIRDETGKLYYSEFIEQYVADSKRFVLLSGPSGVGKTPLRKAVEKELKFKRAVLYTNREPRRGEVDGMDYHFRTREQIIALRDNPRYVVGKVRDMLQAIDLGDLDFSENNLVYVEAYHILGSQLRKSVYLPPEVIPISVFMSPLSMDEITGFKNSGVDLESCITELMKDKLKVRTSLGGTSYEKLSPDKQKEIDIKAKDAYSELKSAHHYNYVLINHDGEGHPNWKTLSGDAGRSVEAFSRIMKFGIYRPHKSIQESVKGRLRIYAVGSYPFKEEAIEYWTSETI